METVKVSSKGQIVIPKALREAGHIQAGTELIISAIADGLEENGVRFTFPLA